MSDGTPRSRRRIMRRSSPDAPQGIVPVLAVLGSLAVVIALTAGSIGGGGGGTKTAVEKKAEATRKRSSGARSVDTRPTTTLVYGETSLFVATTTPYTTTSSSTTTSTLPSEKSLSVRPGTVTFQAGGTSATFTVRTTSTTAVSYFVIGLPDGISARPASGRVTRAKTATVTLTLTDPAAARSGVITVVGSDGSQVRVPVEVPGSDFAVSSVTFQPVNPVCNQTAQITVTVTGDVATSVQVQLAPANNGAPPLTLLSIGNGRWLGTLPAAAQGTTVSGTVTATNDRGRAVQQAFSYTVGGWHGC